MKQDWDAMAIELNNFGDPQNVTRLAKTVHMSGPQEMRRDNDKVVY